MRPPVDRLGATPPPMEELPDGATCPTTSRRLPPTTGARPGRRVSRTPCDAPCSVPGTPVTAASVGSLVGGLVLLLGAALVVGAYFVPTVVAFGRDARQANVVLVLNLFLGWSLVG